MTESGLIIYMVVTKGKESFFVGSLVFPLLFLSHAGVWRLYSMAWLMQGNLANRAVHWLGPQAHSAGGAFRN